MSNRGIFPVNDEGNAVIRPMTFLFLVIIGAAVGAAMNQNWVHLFVLLGLACFCWLGARYIGIRK